MGNYVALKIRGKVHFHLDITVTEGGTAKDFTGWTSFECELKATDDPDGANIGTVLVQIDVPTSDPTLGLLDLDITEADTTLIQSGGVLSGIVDIRAQDGAGEYQLIAQGDWSLIKGVTD